ncbi:OmpA family protein [Brevundimonas sp. Root1279]|uniref:OmpA family protein n=1 Tax=Brevundimonas sp. Root1279 TaxID=1736443 RepID=UPI00138F9988|nr:OmpA family protein [Brevundimonas sp. Root1279]
MTAIAAAAALAAGAVATDDALAQARITGTITANHGDSLTVRGSAGDTPVSLTPATEIRGTSGVLGVRGEEHPASDLIPGLIVDIDIVPGAPVLTAEKVTFKNSDLRTAEQISAGLVGTEGRVAENTARIDNFGTLTSAGRTSVYFNVGSAALSDEGRRSLDDIAAQAKALNTPFRLAVVGRADPTGNAEANRRLSERRAQAVTDYLMHNAGVTPEKFIPTASLGEAPIANDPDPPRTDAEARRVTVTIGVTPR